MAADFRSWYMYFFYLVFTTIFIDKYDDQQIYIYTSNQTIYTYISHHYYIPYNPNTHKKIKILWMFLPLKGHSFVKWRIHFMLYAMLSIHLYRISWYTWDAAVQLYINCPWSSGETFTTIHVHRTQIKRYFFSLKFWLHAFRLHVEAIYSTLPSLFQVQTHPLLLLHYQKQSKNNSALCFTVHHSFLRFQIFLEAYIHVIHILLLIFHVTWMFYSHSVLSVFLCLA